MKKMVFFVFLAQIFLLSRVQAFDYRKCVTDEYKKYISGMNCQFDGNLTNARPNAFTGCTKALMNDPEAKKNFSASVKAASQLKETLETELDAIANQEAKRCGKNVEVKGKFIRENYPSAEPAAQPDSGLPGVAK